MWSEACELFNDDCKADCYWNFKGLCVSDELDEEDKAKAMTLDNNCPNYVHPHLEETVEMRSYIRKNMSKVDSNDVELIYTLLKGLNERRIES